MKVNYCQSFHTGIRNILLSYYFRKLYKVDLEVSFTMDLFNKLRGLNKLGPEFGSQFLLGNSGGNLFGDPFLPFWGN